MGGKGGPNSQQAHVVVMTSMRRNDVASTSFRRHVLTRFLINQCQIITFLILKSDIIENSRIELRGIVLPLPSNQIKVAFIIIFPFNLVHLCFFPVSHRNRRKRWVDYWRGAKGYVGPPLKLLGGGAWPPPLAPLFLRLCCQRHTYLHIQLRMQRLSNKLRHPTQFWTVSDRQWTAP